MNNPADVESRNALGPAYVAADNLYNHALTLARMCDTWSKSDRGPHITPVAATLLRHNLSQAQDNLAALRQALAESLDPRDDRVAITPAEAISMLPDGDSIHTLRPDKTTYPNQQGDPMTTYLISGIYTAQILINTTRRMTRHIHIEIEASSENEAIRETIDKLLFEVMDNGESMINENITGLTALIIEETR